MAVARSRPFLVGASHQVMAVVRASLRSSAESCVQCWKSVFFLTRWRTLSPPSARM